MTWFRVDDGWWSHPKVLGLSLQARGLWVTAGSWCSQHGTDGVVPAKVLRTFGARSRQAEELCASKLWRKVDGGWIFHEWESRNPTRAAIEEDRRKTAARVKQWRERNAVTNAVSNAAPGNAAPSRPDPSRPVPIKKEESESADRAPPPGAAAPPPDPSVGLQIHALEKRYSAGVAAEARTACALSRRNGKLADSVWLRVLKQLDAHPPDVVEKAIEAFTSKHADGDKDERYLLGIVRREASGNGTSNGSHESAADAERYRSWANNVSELRDASRERMRYGDTLHADRIERQATEVEHAGPKAWTKYIKPAPRPQRDPNASGSPTLLGAHLAGAFGGLAK